jgi:DNA-damage-inducible protein J
MAKTGSLYIRIDPELKRATEKLYARYGLKLTDAINVFLHTSLDAGGLPFELHRQWRYNEETEAAIQETRDIMSGKIKAKVYHSVAEMNADLDAMDEDDDEC